MGIPAFVYLFAGVVLALLLMVVLQRRARISSFVFSGAGLVGIAVFIDQVARWDVLGTGWNDTPWIAALVFVLVMAGVYQRDNLGRIARREQRLT